MKRKRLDILDPNISEREFCKLLKTSRKTVPLNELEQSSTNAIKKAKVQENPEEKQGEETKENCDEYAMAPTTRGNMTLWLNRMYKYRITKKVGAKSYWKCAFLNGRICPATAITETIDGKTIGSNKGKHICAPHPPGFQVAFQRFNVKEEAKRTLLKPLQIVADSKRNLTNEELVCAASDEADMAAIRRERKKYKQVTLQTKTETAENQNV